MLLVKSDGNLKPSGDSQANVATTKVAADSVVDTMVPSVTVDSEVPVEVEVARNSVDPDNSEATKSMEVEVVAEIPILAATKVVAEKEDEEILIRIVTKVETPTPTATKTAATPDLVNTVHVPVAAHVPAVVPSPLVVHPRLVVHSPRAVHCQLVVRFQVIALFPAVAPSQPTSPSSLMETNSQLSLQAPHLADFSQTSLVKSKNYPFLVHSRNIQNPKSKYLNKENPV